MHLGSIANAFHVPKYAWKQ